MGRFELPRRIIKRPQLILHCFFYQSTTRFKIILQLTDTPAYHKCVSSTLALVPLTSAVPFSPSIKALVATIVFSFNSLTMSEKYATIGSCFHPNLFFLRKLNWLEIFLNKIKLSNHTSGTNLPLFTWGARTILVEERKSARENRRRQKCLVKTRNQARSKM